MNDKDMTPLARTLRKNMTRQERRLWYDYLRSYPVRFMRQRPMGNYIVDFYCARARLAIELDGSQHFDEPGMTKDQERTEALNALGVQVLRIPNNAIDNGFEGVCMLIDHTVTSILQNK